MRRVATRACRRAVAALVLASVTASAVALGAPGERASDAAKPQADASATAGVLPAREPAVRARTAAPPELPPAAVDPSRERDAVLYEAPGDGSLWARGATYKAGFGTEGTLYVPFLGSDAPRVWPVAFRLESVSVGGLALAFDRAAAPVREGDVVRYERGGLLERYELAPGSIEQELVFGALPGSGELVARFAFESDATARETAQGFRFENDRGAVLYGRATALDAGGASVPAATVLTEGGIEIRVPASFVAGARFPLTIDPVVSTFVIDGSTADSLLPDVAYDATTDRWLVVFEEIFSESDHDVYFRLLTSNGTATIANGYVDASLSAYWARPTCANHASADQFLVAAAVGLPSSGARTIQGRTISAGGLLSAAFPISGTDQGGDKLNPDVGGDPYEGTAYYAVVWERVFDPGDRDVHARLITPGGVPTTTNTILIDNSGATVDTVPSISKSNMASIWNVAWQRGPTFGGSIRAARVAWTGSIFTPSFAVPNASSAANPSASSSLAGTHRWAVAYELYPTLAVDVGITLLDGGAVLDQVDLTALEARIDPSFQWLAQFDPTVDSDGEAFAVAYTEPREVGDDLDYDVYAATVSVVGDRLALGEGHRLVLGSNGPEDAPELASRAGSGGAPRRHMIVWDTQGFTSGNPPGDIEGGLYDVALFASFCHPGFDGVGACPCGNDPDGYGRGCDNSQNLGGGRLSLFGLSSLSADTLSLFGSELRSNALAVFNQGDQVLAGATPFGQGLRCVGGNLKRLYLATTFAGATATVPGVGDPSVSARSAALGDPIGPGSTRAYYVYYRDPVVLGGCPAGATFNTTQAVQAIWMP